MPAAAVIPAPKVYANFVVVKKLVVDNGPPGRDERTIGSLVPRGAGRRVGSAGRRRTNHTKRRPGIKGRRESKSIALKESMRIRAGRMIRP